MTTIQLKAIMLGGAIISLVSLVPFLNLVNCMCCAGIISGGVVSVFYYKKQLPSGQAVDAGKGVVIGLFSGLVAVVITGVIVTTSYLSGHLSGSPQVEQFLQNYTLPSEEIPPEMTEFFQQFQGEEGNMLLLILHLIFNAVFFPAFGMIGGLIGTAIGNGSKEAPSA
jgi:hypothetical protein